jgi:hypothetical protein
VFGVGLEDQIPDTVLGGRVGDQQSRLQIVTPTPEPFDELTDVAQEPTEDAEQANGNHNDVSKIRYRVKHFRFLV